MVMPIKNKRGGVNKADSVSVFLLLLPPDLLFTLVNAEREHRDPAPTPNNTGWHVVVVGRIKQILPSFHCTYRRDVLWRMIVATAVE